MKHKTESITQADALVHNKGFTLIELLIAVAILAILAAIAIPSYTEHVTRVNRTEAKTILTQTAQALERCYSRFSAYNSTNCNVSFPITSEAGHYQIAQPASDDLKASSFTLRAEPQPGGQASREEKSRKPCGVFTLKHDGTRDVVMSEDGAEVGHCW